MPLSQRLKPQQYQLDQSISLDGHVDQAGSSNRLDNRGSLPFFFTVIFVHFRIGDSIEGMTPALAMLFGAATLFFTRPVKYGMGKLTGPTDGNQTSF
jgi:hypothetical protein